MKDPQNDHRKGKIKKSDFSEAGGVKVIEIIVG